MIIDQEEFSVIDQFDIIEIDNIEELELQADIFHNCCRISQL